jgi:pyridoxine kinase
MAVLSIQSHVALGHVGNGAAAFALQRLGIEAWAVPTAHLSNHPGHGHHRGRIADAADVRALLDGLAALGVYARCQAVLSGYLGSVEVGLAALDAVRAVKAANPSALYLCDPVLGDDAEGRYVAEGLAEFFRERAMPMADIVCPNAFELGLLTGQPGDATAWAAEAARMLLARGPRMVVVTSLVGADGVGTLAVTADDAWLVTTPRLDRVAKGAGDLLAAVLLGWLLRGLEMEAALARSVAAVFGVLAVTDRLARDLNLVEGQESIVNSMIRFKPTRVR